MIRSDHHIFTGMQKDTSISKQPSQYLFDAKNIRLTAREGRTSLSITNEKGPKELSLVYKIYNGSEWEEQIVGHDYDEQTETEIPIYPEIEGTYMGHCTINNYLVLFTYIDESTDAIYRINLKTKEGDSYVTTRLYRGKLDFKLNHPLETLASYENESIQKVYWTDNENQPRLINIAPYRDKFLSKYSETPTPFDFSPELALGETISVSKKYSGGSFAAGVIQYAITYYNKYAQETAIVATTPLYYISPFGRGGSPEETCSNSFVITVSNVDKRFEYLRIYSIQRTSLNGTAICKRIQDIQLGSDDNVQYIDTGTNGDIVDPSSLLFVGGEEVTAETLCQKDSTLFLGNISIKRPSITSEIKTEVENFFYTNNPTPVNGNSTSRITMTTRTCKHSKIIASGDFKYASTLEEYCAGFKDGEYYRLGLQFQYKTGNWSEPIWIMDYQMNGYAGLNNDGVPMNTTLKTKLSSDIVSSLERLGYRKVRAMIATPSLTNRTVIFQGVYNPTMYRFCDRYGANPTENNLSTSGEVGHLYGQASWIFRPASPSDRTNFITTNYGGIISGGNGGGPLVSQYENDHIDAYLGPYSRSTEIQGYFPANSRFFVENESIALATVNSPDILWDNDVLNYNFGSSCKMSRVGFVTCSQDYADIDITTSSSTIGSLGSGFIHRAFNTEGYAGLLSQLCYQDNVVNDENGGTYGIDSELKYPTMWVVYMWHRNGSLNNDVNRAGRSAMLQTKKISNYRVADTNYYDEGSDFPLTDVKIFNSDELQYLKVGGKPYLGNVDTMLAPENSGFYFSNYPNNAEWETRGTYESKPWARLINGKRNGTTDVGLLQYFDADTNTWKPTSGESGTWTKIGDKVFGLGASREGIRMKYKSTPHAVVYGNHVYPGNGINNNYYPVGTLPIVEIYEPYNADTLYGGTSEDALKAISWIPAGPAVAIDADTNIEWLWGDTFFNRWDCLKTYAFSKEDQNQVVDILSFPVESHINLDGRYDKNRGQSSNLNMSPTNYNLMNMVYSQLNNFFSYRIMDSDYYDLGSFHNQITWTSEKAAGSSVDPWTQITLASTHDLDGSKGQVRALKTWKNDIYCFQDTGIANIIFNPRVQIPASDGVPIEIGNSHKVEGKRYLSETLGCINKSTICESPSSLYFIDNISKDLYAISPNGLIAVSDTCNMRTWFSGLPKDKWTSEDYTTKVFYDSTYKDLYITTEDTCLCFSETLGQFVSFMSYEGTSAMLNIGSSFYALRDGDTVTLWEMFEGYYSMFFGTYKPFSLTFISNADSALDKTFLNLEIQADFYDSRLDTTGEPFYHKTNTLNNRSLNPKRFFNSVRIETEYQDSGVVSLNWKNFRSFGSSPYFKTANAAKKNRIWRIELPRDKSNNTKVYDRMRNTWAKVTLENNAVDPVFMELHNISVEYFV